MKFLALRWVALAFVATLVVSHAHAQSSAEELAQINQEAMDAYNQLELDRARDMLENAISEAQANGVSGTVLARSYVNLGVVLVGGFGDESAGEAQFVMALKEDSEIELDPLVSTPEISAVFDRARSRAFSDAPPAQAGGPVPGNLDHSPVAEQASQTGVPVYVEVDDDLEVETVRVFYRSLGMTEPASADMQRVDDGWGYIIPCTDVYEPTVEYFIVAIDEDGQQVGNAGTPRNPVVVPIRSSISGPAPSLPGQPPPNKCGGEECPPGMPGCSAGGGLGDTCRSSADCGSGLVCDDNFCAVGERDDDDDDDGGDRGDAPRFFVRAGGGMGLSVVKDGMPTNTVPDPAFFSGIDNSNVEELNARAAEAGYRCDFSTGSIRDCEAIVSGGLVATPAIRFEAGMYVSERVSLSLIGRFQPGAGGDRLAGFLIGGRLGYLLTQPRAEGFHSTLFVGVTGGQINPQPKLNGQAPTYNGVTVESPYIASGLGGFHAGTMLGYRFVRNFGLYLSPEADFQIPDFLFNLDLTAGVELAF